MSESEFVSHPNTHTLHRGTREDGAECGTQSERGWAPIEAENPAEAVLRFATPTCTRCFKRSRLLDRLYLIEHSATVCQASVADVLERLPWDVPDEREARPDGGRRAYVAPDERERRAEALDHREQAARHRTIANDRGGEL